MNADTGLLGPVWAGSGLVELLADEAWVAAMLEVEVALARTQARLGVIPAAAVEPIAAAAASARVDVAGLAVRARGAANPVVELVRALTSAVRASGAGDAAEYVHLGSTSQDILDTAAMLLTARALRRTDAALCRVADALAGLAAEHRHTAMAARTLTQHAVPTTFGLKAAGWLHGVLDATDRLRHTLDTLPVQVGGAAGTLAAYVEYAGRVDGHAAALSEGVAAELGLRPGPPWHTRRTPLVDVGWVVVTVTGALGKLALDVLGATRTEVGEVVEPAGGTSSAMPQKQNPVLATMIMSAARQAPAYAAMLGQSMLAEDERSPGGWQSEWQPLCAALRLAGGAAETAAQLVEGLRVVPERLAANLASTGGTVVAERLTVALAPVLGRTAAKDLLGRLAGRAAAGDGTFDDLLRAAPELAAVDLADLLDPTHYLGASAELVDQALARHRATPALPDPA